MKTLACLLLLASSLSAQVVHLTGGDSTLMNASGGGLSFILPNNEFDFSGGILGGHTIFGITDVTTIRGFTVTTGDQQSDVSLPTDLSSARIQTRGVSVSRKTDDSAFSLFAGSQALQTGTPFFLGAKPNAGIAVFSLRRRLTKRWEVTSTEIAASRQTAVEGVAFSSGHIHASAAGGIGNNSLFAAGHVDARATWGEIAVTDSKQASTFQRIGNAFGITLQNAGLNIAGDAHWKMFRVSAIHNGLVLPVSQNEFRTAKMDEGSLSWSSQTSSMTATGYRSTFAGKTSTGESVAGSQRWDGTTLSAGYYSSSTSSIMTAAIDQRIGHHLHVNGGISDNRGVMNVTAAGGWEGNRLTVEVTHNVVYLPVLGRFQQVIGGSISLRLSHSATVDAQTIVLPTGGVKATVYGSEYFDGPLSEEIPHSQIHGKWIVTGRVKDVGGHEVEGVPVQIGRVLAYTNSEGTFFVRQKNGKPQAVAVRLDKFADLRNWKVVSAPTLVAPSRDMHTVTVDITIAPE